MTFERYSRSITSVVPNTGGKIVHIIVDNSDGVWNDKKQQLAGLTWKSALREGVDVLFTSSIDDGCIQAGQYDIALVSYVGTIYRSIRSHTENDIYHYLQQWSLNNDNVCKGIIKHCLFVNLEKWRQLNCPRLENSNLERLSSIELACSFYAPNQHQTYNNYQCQDARVVYRDAPSYCDSLNNVSLNKQFDIIYAPAIGNVAEYLYDQYGHNQTVLNIWAADKKQLMWKEALYGSYGVKPDSPQFFDRMARIVAAATNSRVDYTGCSLFSDDQWIDVLQRIQHYQIVESNVHDLQITSDPSKSTLVYTGNTFSENNLYFNIDAVDLLTKYNAMSQLGNATIIGNHPNGKFIVNENYSS